MKKRFTIPKRMYHGTAFINASKIFKQGITPRGNRKGNWDKYVSRDSTVYLTVAYPFYFAEQAVWSIKKDQAIVFEIDLTMLDQRLLYPDEDFISQAFNDIENHEHYKQTIEQYRDCWALSVEHLGSCCYKGMIPKKAFTRTCRVDFDKRRELWMAVMDPTISLMNYKFCGDKYRDMIAWFFGDIELLPQVEQAKIYPDDIKCQQIKVWTEASHNRDGITVTNLKG